MTTAPTSLNSSAGPSTSLLLFAPAQNPLPVRYPHPHKPRLHLPALVHRALHSALDGEQPSFAYTTETTTASSSTSGSSSTPSSGPTLVIPHPDSIIKQDEPVSADKVYLNGTSPSSTNAKATGADEPSQTLTTEAHVPSGPEGLVGAQVESEITLKLHLVGQPSSSSASTSASASAIASERLEWVREALSVARTHKGLSRVDTLLIGFKGVDYKGKKTAVSEFFGCGAEGMESGSGVENVAPEVEEEVVQTWCKVRDEVRGGGEAEVGRLGTLYLPLGVLRRLTEMDGDEGAGKEGEVNGNGHGHGNGKGNGNGQGAHEKGRQGPVINMLDTPDCHSLPKEYMAYAKEKDIALWAGGGGEGAGELISLAFHVLFVRALSASADMSGRTAR